MLLITVHSGGEERALEHRAGPLEVGRGPQRDVPRCQVSDPYVSRDHVRFEEQPGGQLRLENLSHTSAVRVGGQEVPTGGSVVVRLPATIAFGHSELEVRAPPAPATQALAPAEQLTSGMETVIRPVAAAGRALPLPELGESPSPETLAHWFETLVLVQQAAATSEAFLDATARAMVDLVGLDRGLVLLRNAGSWRVGASAGAPPTGAAFSSTIVHEAERLQRTVFRNLGAEAMSSSLVGIDTVVAAPVLNAAQTVVGVVYGARSLRTDRPPPRIAPLEALVVQVLAAAVGAGLEREAERERALRSQVQFEQFFSPRLARELALDPALLEGREREVSLLFSDVRDFSRISERLGARRTFEMMQEIMDLQSLQIRETDGVVVDYVGDGLLAMWNAPADQPDHAVLACRAAAAILCELPALSERWLPEAGEPVRLGIGVHTGAALVGNTGSRVKFKYGPMGSAVNLASRVENATKTLGVGALLTGATRDRLNGAFGTRRLGGVFVQGFATPVDLFELYPGEANAEWATRRDVFEQALAHFEARRWSEACQLLAGLLSSGSDY
ncbi:MAG: adenylate/guanylate cyclase domain-containing protein, partial [Dehalococcoidia bacterium]|nr:adenylate/guanylate cyclase domain-containing protein [Dehalococcoidia bacterium]